MRKLILTQPQSPGDILVFTRLIADLKTTYPAWQIDVRTPCPEIFENNPHLTPLSERDPQVQLVTIKADDDSWLHKSGWSCIHYAEGMIRDAERYLGMPITRTSIRPEIYLSEAEKKWTNQVQTEFGYSGKFWLINAGYKPECPLKYYPYYQEVVHLLRDKIQFVQIGHKDHIHPPLEGVFNLIGKTDLRQLIRLCYWAQGTLGGISFQMHLAAAYQAPAVVLAGAKEGPHWELYPNQRYLYTNGALKCGAWDGCWKSKLTDCVNLTGGYARCFTMIHPATVAEAVTSYYRGGMLTFD
jgi:ADP-heptose:LPS heptosyltransferase